MSKDEPLLSNCPLETAEPCRNYARVPGYKQKNARKDKKKTRKKRKMNGVEINARALAYVATRFFSATPLQDYCRLNRTMNADFPPPEKNCIQVHTNFPRRRKVRVHSSIQTTILLRWDHLYAVTLKTKVFGDYNHARLEVSWITSTRGLLLRGYTGETEFKTKTENAARNTCRASKCYVTAW